jgi:hypothetical protein
MGRIEAIQDVFSFSWSSVVLHLTGIRSLILQAGPGGNWNNHPRNYLYKLEYMLTTAQLRSEWPCEKYAFLYILVYVTYIYDDKEISGTASVV